MVKLPSVERPTFLLIAGPNGSGKSSVYVNADVETFGRSVWIVNPDLLTVRIRTIERQSLRRSNLLAVQRIERWIDASLDAHQSVGAETVLSTDKYRRLVSKAKGLGYEIDLIYIILRDPQLNVERVRLRVGKGGHHVPKRKVVERYARSLRQLPWFLEQADRAWIYDNSGAVPRTIGRKQSGVIELDVDAVPALIDAIRDFQANS